MSFTIPCVSVLTNNFPHKTKIEKKKSNLPHDISESDATGLLSQRQKHSILVSKRPPRQMEILCGMVSSRQSRDSLLFSLLFPSQEKLVEQDGGIGTLNPSWCLWEQPLFLQKQPIHHFYWLIFLYPSWSSVSYWAWLAHGFTNCSNSNIRSTASKPVCSFRERKALLMHSTAVAASSCFKSG